MIKRALVGLLACLGFSGNQAKAISQPHEISQRQSVIKNGATTREIKEDHFGGFLNGIRGQFMRSRGRTPYEFGISRECAQMRRKNSMRGKGIRAAAI